VQISTAKESLLSEQDLMEVERAHPQGITSAQIIQIFQSRGIRFSEATFRKYVQLGLLPRSRRVGSKGKHRGSRGLYPCATVRRINAIKTLMAENLTIEEIQRRLSTFMQRIQAVESALDDLFQTFERELAQPRFDVARRRSVSRDVQSARVKANELVRQVIQIENRVSLVEQRAQSAGEGVFADW